MGVERGEIRLTRTGVSHLVDPTPFLCQFSPTIGVLGGPQHAINGVRAIGYVKARWADLGARRNRRYWKAASDSRLESRNRGLKRGRILEVTKNQLDTASF
jgi:hypothetical protein